MAKKPDLTTDILELEQILGENAVQFSLARQITIPEEVKKIKDVEAITRDLKTEIVEEKVMVEGIVIGQLFYLNESGQENIYDFQEEFVAFVLIPGATPVAAARAYPRVELIRYDELKKDQGMTYYNQVILIEIYVVCCQKISQQIVVGADEVKAQKITREKLNIQSFVGAKVDETTVTSDIVLREPAARLGQVSSKFDDDTRMEVTDNQVVIQGSLINNIDYQEETSGSSREEVISSKFQYTADIEGLKPEMQVGFIPRVKYLVHEINPQERNKIKLKAWVSFFIRVQKPEEIEVIVDIEGFVGARDTLSLCLDSQDVSDQLSLSGQVTLEGPVSKLSPAGVDLQEIRGEVQGDILEVTGILKTSFNYVKDQTGKIEQDFWEEHYTHRFKVKGILGEPRLYLYPRLEEIKYEMLDDPRQIRQVAVLNIYARVTTWQERVLISGAANEKREERGKSQASGITIVVYVVQKEESIFSIAQNFNVSIESILKANKIDDPEEISSGQKILIPCSSDC